MNKIKVVAVGDGKIYNHDMTKLTGEIREWDIYEATLYEETEEYFTKDSEGREVFVGEIDRYGGLKLDDLFELYMGE